GINLTAFSFDKFINALKQQGKTSVLSNPKISVMNGQPALISVGREVTFINSIESSTTENKPHLRLIRNSFSQVLALLYQLSLGTMMKLL
ncbi:hypothetical protein VU10_02920, partial [Desulfobulbus sp. US1]|nr:hypothetical protein [Desulfobulbus sp. US1]